MMTDITYPTKLSGEYFVKRSFAIAMDAEPDIGRNTSSGRASAGTPSAENIGDISEQITSTAPEAVNIFTPTSRSMRTGSRPVAVLNPFSAPVINSA